MDTCIYFLESLVEPNDVNSVVLILLSEQTDVDHVIDELEPMAAIKEIYLCSKHAANIKYRRVLAGRFHHMNDLCMKLCTEKVWKFFQEAGVQIEVHKDKAKVRRCMEQMEEFSQLLKTFQAAPDTETK